MRIARAVVGRKMIMFCAILSLLSGCGDSGPELAAVTGTITLDGNPLHGALVTFRPTGEVATTSYGVSNKDGFYSLMFTRDKSGAMPGDYEVDIETTMPSKSELAEMKAEGKEPPPFVPLPKKYKQPGALTAKVASGKNTIDFPLDTK